MGRFTGKVALLTGATSGMAEATARQLVAEGAHVYVTGRGQKALDRVVGELGDQATGVRGDVADLGDLSRLFETIRDGHGRLDVVFASAGAGDLMEPLSAVTPESFDQVFAVNVRGTLFTVQHAVALMSGGGAIVINGTVAAVKGIPGTGVYSASKAALRSLVRTWTAELAPAGIRVNLLSPGTINTPPIAALSSEFTGPIVAQIPLGRIGQPSEIATAVAFLASDDASFITGVELFVDGGMGQV